MDAALSRADSFLRLSPGSGLRSSREGQYAFQYIGERYHPFQTPVMHDHSKLHARFPHACERLIDRGFRVQDENPASDFTRWPRIGLKQSVTQVYDQRQLVAGTEDQDTKVTRPCGDGTYVRHGRLKSDMYRGGVTRHQLVDWQAAEIDKTGNLLL